VKRIVTTLIATVALAAIAPAQTTKKAPADPVSEMAGKLEPTRKVAYKKAGDRELFLHVFEPAGHQASDRRACFVTIHGGGWVGGEPRRFYPFAAHFAKLGMVGISVEYRLAKPGSGVTPFDCAKDARSAVRYVRVHAAELGIHPGKLITNGGSAGGHLAAAALFEGVDEAGDDLKISPVPNAMALLFPVIDTSAEGYGNAKCGAEWEKISPLHRVKSGLPPTIVFHGTADTTTPFNGAKAFHEAMLKAGNRCELVVNEGGKHGYLMFNRAQYDETMKRTEEFLTSLGLLKQP